LVSMTVDNSDFLKAGFEEPARGVTYLGEGSSDENAREFYEKLIEDEPAESEKDPDLNFKPVDIDVQIDVSRDFARSTVGGGSEFGSGVAGLGRGYTGGVSIFFKMNSDGASYRNAKSRIASTYKKIVKMPGGL